MPKRTAMAIGAHPDDIEFHMAGTLLLLARAGYEIHYLNIGSGNCGSTRTNSAQTRAIRQREARAAAAVLRAKFHRGFADDLEILYQLPLLRRLAALIREVAPEILLTHSPQDYMEDHMTTCRLVVTAAFARGMPNFKTSPARPAHNGNVTIYHAMPHGLRDQLRNPVIPDTFADTSSVQELKREALAQHRSQHEWLDQSQGFNSYVQAMDDMSREVGRLSRKFKYAEGWRHHLHLGFSASDVDPLADALGAQCLMRKQKGT